MLDVLMILLAVGLFATSAAYVRVCERLVDGRGPDVEGGGGS